ncbi:hypothetical protein [Streptomyces fulvoviolaceus]|uniref:hypothetical protein n=1 Tax=Streptomyces fulvoviolaceus TaxID=285535 RepID=UPI0009966220|nr:hypothetical protein [Streptomyces fulvoviolaceus]
MRERPDVRKKRIDLNVPQVAGGAVAAVVAAKLASYFGVYGTILGAGVVSAIATCGGSVFQHFFRRTGEQLREATVAPKALGQEPPAVGEFTAGTVYRARVRSWKRPVLAAALVFGVTMAGITTYELASGTSFSGGKGTTVSSAVTGQDSSSSKSGDGTPTSTTSGTPSAPADDSTPSNGATSSGDTTSSPTPTPSTSDDSGTPSPTPSESATTPTPSASSRSGSADQDQDDPAGQ